MEEKLLKIINKFGINNQQRKLAEEVFELQEAIMEMQNKKWEMEGKGPEVVEPILNDYRLHIAEEIADVEVMLLQFKEYYYIDGKDILKIMNEKIDRTIDRMKKGFYENERNKNNI